MANAEHLEILKRTVGAWNQWRQRNPNVQPDLSEADLRGDQLSGANLSNALLHDSKLVRTVLNKANLAGANLNNARLRWAQLAHADLTGAKLSLADLRETNFNDATLNKADLGEANLSQATLQSTSLNEANLSGANFNHADLRGSKLNYANLTGANLANTNLINAKLTHANLNKAELSKAQLKGADLSYADFDGTNLSGASLYEVDLRNATFTGANVTGVDFTRAIADEHQFGPDQLSNKQREQLQFSIEITVKEPAAEQSEEKQAKHRKGVSFESIYGKKNDVRAIIEEAAREGWTELDLSDRGITELPEEIGQLERLETLHLFGNQLTGVPVGFGKLVGLTVLGLHNNRLMEVPKEIWQLTNLTLLNLSSNQLKEVPKGVGQLEKLQRLFVSDNQLTKVSKEIGKLVSLKVLYLNNNQLTEVPKEIEELKKLRDIILTGNNIPNEEVKRMEDKMIGIIEEGEPSEGEVEEADRAPIEKASIGGYSICDQPTDVDSLGFEPYTTAIAEFLSHKDTKPPLTMSIEGEWGSGKSSFMLQLSNKLSKKGGLIVTFSPWRHEEEDSVWAAFVLTFTDQLSKQLYERSGLVKCLKVRLKLVQDRFDWRKGWPAVAKVAAQCLAYVLILIGVLTVLWAGGIPYLQHILAKVFLTFGSVMGVGWKGLKSMQDFVGNPFEHELKKYIEKPDYTGRTPFIEEFHKDFKKVVEAYAGGKKIYVLIDDLDRCAVPKAGELMQAINLMVSDDPQLIFVLGMDRGKVAAGLAVKHREIIPYLNPRLVDQNVDGAGDSNELAGLRYGYSFIEKFVQLPFTIPRATESEIQTMMDVIATELPLEVTEIASADRVAVSTDKVDKGRNKTEISETEEPAGSTEDFKESETKEEQQRWLELRIAEDSEQVKAIVNMVASSLDCNPRRVKQFINLFRLRAYIAYETQLLILPENIGGSEGGVTLEQLGKMVAIGLKWPLFAESLERDESLLEMLADFAEARPRPIKSLEDDIAKRWAEESKLMELMRYGCLDEEGEKDIFNWSTYTLCQVNVARLLQVLPKTTSIAELSSEDESAPPEHEDEIRPAVDRDISQAGLELESNVESELPQEKVPQKMAANKFKEKRSRGGKGKKIVAKKKAVKKRVATKQAVKKKGELKKDTLIDSSSKTLRWLSSIKAKVEAKNLSLEYNEAKYWATLKSPQTNRNIAYLHAQKTQIRLFTRLNPSFDSMLQTTPASHKWADMYPSIFKIRNEESINKAVKLIVSSYEEDSQGSGKADHVR